MGIKRVTRKGVTSPLVLSSVMFLVFIGIAYIQLITIKPVVTTPEDIRDCSLSNIVQCFTGITIRYDISLFRHVELRTHETYLNLTYVLCVKVMMANKSFVKAEIIIYLENGSMVLQGTYVIRRDPVSKKFHGYYRVSKRYMKIFVQLPEAWRHHPLFLPVEPSPPSETAIKEIQGNVFKVLVGSDAVIWDITIREQRTVWMYELFGGWEYHTGLCLYLSERCAHEVYEHGELIEKGEYLLTAVITRESVETLIKSGVINDTIANSQYMVLKYAGLTAISLTFISLSLLHATHLRKLWICPADRRVQKGIVTILPLITAIYFALYPMCNDIFYHRTIAATMSVPLILLPVLELVRLLLAVSTLYLFISNPLRNSKVRKVGLYTSFTAALLTLITSLIYMYPPSYSRALDMWWVYDVASSEHSFFLTEFTVFSQLINETQAAYTTYALFRALLVSSDLAIVLSLFLLMRLILPKKDLSNSAITWRALLLIGVLLASYPLYDRTAYAIIGKYGFPPVSSLNIWLIVSLGELHALRGLRDLPLLALLYAPFTFGVGLTMIIADTLLVFIPRIIAEVILSALTGFAFPGSMLTLTLYTYVLLIPLLIRSVLAFREGARSIINAPSP